MTKPKKRMPRWPQPLWDGTFRHCGEDELIGRAPAPLASGWWDSEYRCYTQTNYRDGDVAAVVLDAAAYSAFVAEVEQRITEAHKAGSHDAIFGDGTTRLVTAIEMRDEERAACEQRLAVARREERALIIAELKPRLLQFGVHLSQLDVEDSE